MKIAESYLDRHVTAESTGIPSRRITGIARKVDTSSAGSVMLWLELPDGSSEHVFLSGVSPELPQATALQKRRAR